MINKVQLDEFDPSQGLNRGAGKFKELCWYFIKIFFFLSPIPFPSGFKCFLLRCFGAKTGKGIVLKPRINIHFPWKLEIGNNVWIGEEVFILNFEPLYIGNHVCVSQRAFLCGGNHDYTISSMPYRNGSITLEDGSWVGANVFIGPNVKIGFNTVISAASVVTKSVDPNGIYSGNPLKFVKNRW